MGGGTWIYLGTFGFDAGKSDAGKVVLSNRSEKAGRIVTADAVKIGGGMGNMARRISDAGATENIKSSQATGATSYELQATGALQHDGAANSSLVARSSSLYEISGYYKCRGIWVNYLAGGSAVNPTEQGLNIPVDMAFAFHSDAGTTLNDSIIGTLGIYYTNVYNEEYANGASRYLEPILLRGTRSPCPHYVAGVTFSPELCRHALWFRSTLPFYGKPCNL